MPKDKAKPGWPRSDGSSGASSGSGGGASSDAQQEHRNADRFNPTARGRNAKKYFPP